MESSVELLFHPLYFTAFILLILVFLLQKWLNSSISDQDSPPSPPKIPIFGHLLSLGSLPHVSLQAYARRHGPLLLLQLGSRRTIVVSSAEMAGEIMKTHDLVFASRPKSSMSDMLFYGSKDIAASPYGAYWRQMKSIAVLHLLSNKMVHSFRSVREQEVKLMIRNIQQNPASVDLSHVFYRLMNDIICRVALGRKYAGAGEDENEFQDLFPRFVKLLGSVSVRDFIPWLGWIHGFTGMDAKVKRVAKEVDDFIDRVIQDHVHPNYNPEEQSKDLVDVLLSIQRQNSLGFPLEMKSIKALILDVFSGGTDTTHTVLEWAMSELLRHPQVMKKLLGEVKEVAGEKEYVSEDDLEKMHYLKAVIKETLRLHPPVPLLIPRESRQDIKLKGYHIKEGTVVMINVWAIGRDPQVWDAEEFRPERFVNSGIDFKGHDLEFTPFGAGRRGCPGVLFAAMLTEITLANLVYKFEWTLPGGADAASLDMSTDSGFAIHRKFPLVAVAVAN